MQTAQLDVVRWGDSHRDARLNLAITAHDPRSSNVATDAPAIGRRRLRRRGHRPKTSIVYVSQVEECSPLVEHGVFAPARDGQVLPSAVAAAFGSHHHVVLAVGK
jgi:hypothetical protein